MRLRRDLFGVALGAGVLVALAAVRPLGAQVVRGVVAERTNGEPVSGVLLSVVDEQGTTVAQALSDDRGSYEVRLPGPGSFVLDAKRIGVRRVTLPALTLGQGEARRIDIAVEPLPAVLTSVRITGRTSCVRNPNTNERTAALWDDAHAALTAAVLTRRLTGASDTVLRYVRKIDIYTGRVLFEDRRRVSTALDRPFRSLPADELSDSGYVRVNADGSTSYFAPDADVLLSEPFLEDHCFRLRQGIGERTGFVGLAFEPIPKRKTPDIKGVLWMDAKTAELRTVEFSYTWLPNDERPSDFGGTVSFFRMPGGRWIVRSWRIRMPEFGLERYAQSYDGRLISLGRTRTPHVVRIAEEGGAVPLDVLLNQAGTVRGTVVADTVSKRPVAGITVALAGTGDSTVTGMDGRFEIPFVQPGSYTVVLRHPALDSLGIEHMARTVEVEVGRAADLDIHFPSNAELASRICDRPVDFERQSIVRFIIFDRSDSVPLANAPARFTRFPIRSNGEVALDSAAVEPITLDAGGGYLACALSVNEVVRIESTPEVVVGWSETVRPRPGAIGWHVVRIRTKP